MGVWVGGWVFSFGSSDCGEKNRRMFTKIAKVGGRFDKIGGVTPLLIPSFQGCIDRACRVSFEAAATEVEGFCLTHNHRARSSKEVVGMTACTLGFETHKRVDGCR